MSKHGDGRDDSRTWPESGLAGQRVEISPWAYAWRADRTVQGKPEAYLIPRRLERVDRIYRTAAEVLPPDQLKSIYYQQPDLLEPMPPKPQGRLVAGLLWTGGLVDYRVVLVWPGGDVPIPAPESVEVRAYPTSFGWFGITVDRILSRPEISADGRTWTYRSDPTLQMDTAYSTRVPAATELVAVFCDAPGATPPVPELHVTGPATGLWRRMEIEVEWGFQPGAGQADFDGRIEGYVALLGPLTPLAVDGGVTIEGADAWRSRGGVTGRRGVRLPLLYAPDIRPGLDSRVTIWTPKGGVTVSLKALDEGPVLVPVEGVFVAKAGSGQTAGAFAKELAAKNLKSTRQRVRAHREAASWDELLQKARLWTCPEGTEVPPFPPEASPAQEGAPSAEAGAEEYVMTAMGPTKRTTQAATGSGQGAGAAMQVRVSDQRWTDAWRLALEQLRGPHMWGNLAHEVGRVVHAMELVGLHAETLKIYDYFVASPGVKSDGDYADGAGSLEWAKSMRHDMGYSHEGTHASTGSMLFSITERQMLIGDAYFAQHRDRLQAAADWIIRERRTYLQEAPNRDELFAAGLMPPCMIGDYALPACDWHWYYCDNALSLQGLQRFADALEAFDPQAAQHYQAEAAAYRQDIRRVVEHEAALAPVRLGQDGMYHHFIPRMAYSGGLTGPELGAPQFPDCDLAWGSLLLAQPFTAMDPNDSRIAETLDAMEEMGSWDDPRALAALEAVSLQRKAVELRKSKGATSGSDDWFWMAYFLLPKISHNSNIYLLEDDVPNFLRFWMNEYAGMVGADGKLWEHWHLDTFGPCEHPDNGTAGWFIENYRNMLVMEDGPALWVGRGVPRAWLEQGRSISVANAPTYFGALSYEMVSEADAGKIAATLELPSRQAPESVLVRFRHPQGAPIKDVTVDGKPWTAFDPDTEVITLTGFSGTVNVVAGY
ncbi:MAG: hypothetical protein ACYC4R_00490 [Anaerolineae bacterium]